MRMALAVRSRDHRSTGGRHGLDVEFVADFVIEEPGNPQATADVFGAHGPGSASTPRGRGYGGICRPLAVPARTLRLANNALHRLRL